MEHVLPLSRQRGASLWVLLGMSALFVLFALITMKLVPAYIDNIKVSNALESLAETPGVASMNRNQMLRNIADQLYIDMAGDLLDLGTTLEIQKQKNVRIVSLNYERVVPMAYNISVLLDFENSVEIPLN